MARYEKKIREEIERERAVRSQRCHAAWQREEIERDRAVRSQRCYAAWQIVSDIEKPLHQEENIPCTIYHENILESRHKSCRYVYIGIQIERQTINKW